MKTFKQQQKEDNKLVNDLINEFSNKELARMVVRERKKKNKYLLKVDQLKVESEGYKHAGEKIQETCHIQYDNLCKQGERIEKYESLVEKWMDKTFDKVEEIKQLELSVIETEYRLLECFISEMPKVYRKRNTNLVIVQEFLQYKTSKQGSTSSVEKCIMLGIDPDGYTLERKEV